MSKAVKMVTMTLVLTVILTLGISSAAFASNYDDNVGNLENPGMGPAPNFGDGIPDGPGW
ncbi:hypothetical protein ACFLUB_02100 [Chloroflexota bacterium]